MSPISDEGLSFNCSEQLYHYKKAMYFGDEKMAELIFKAKTPWLQKQLSRKIANFSYNKWHQVSQAIMMACLFQKFIQNPELGDMLLETGTDLLAEGSPFDRLWGVGRGLEDPWCSYPTHWLGANRLGQCLMQVRLLMAEKRAT